MSVAFFSIVQMLKRHATNHRAFVFAHTANKTLRTEHSGSVHTNLGATGGVTLTLPQNAVKGNYFTFVVAAAQTLTIDPGAAGGIYLGGAKLADDTALASSHIGATVTLTCDGNNDWVVTGLSERGHWLSGGDVNTETLAGNATLTTASARYQRLDPGGAGRDVTLPAEADSKGLAFLILNTADAAEDLTVKDDGASTVVTISQNEAALVVCNGTSWVHMGIQSIALT